MIIKQEWSFRAECRRDVEEWFPEAFTNKREIQQPHVKMALLHFSQSDINGVKIPDVGVEVKFSTAEYREHGPCYRGHHQLMLGICDIVDMIAAVEDTHVILGSLKPTSLYDGERNGPFVNGSKMVRAMMEFN